MKKILFVICVAYALCSCSKKDPAAVAPTDPWVKQGYLYNQGGFVNMLMVRDTFVALCNEFSGPRFYMGDGGLGGFYGYNAPATVNNNAITLFRAYEDRVFAGTINEGVYYSTDISRSWTKLTTDLPATVYANDIVGTDAGLYLCAQKIYFSTDQGDHWTDISVPDMVQATTIVKIDNTLIARVVTSGSAGNAVLYTSTDNGTNWTAVDPASEMGQLPFYNFAAVDNMLFGITYVNSYTSELYVSKDKGANWTLCNGLNAKGNNAVSSVILYKGTVYAGTNLGVFKSADKGKSWTYSGVGNNTVSLLIRNNALYAITRSGIWKVVL